MATHKDVDTMNAELESRLNDLFGEDERFSEGPAGVDFPEEYPLGELKNLVLSIDWEITDEVLVKFLGQINQLKTIYKNDRINLTFLQILGALGGYIKTFRGKAHPKTFKTLNSVFSKFDDVVLSKGMPESEKKKILRIEMNKYKELREQISRAKIRKEVAKPIQKIKPQFGAQQPDDEFLSARGADFPAKTLIEALPGTTADNISFSEEIAKAVEEIKKFIHTEIKALREELNLE